MTSAQLRSLRNHLQTAIEIELATIPIYLYTYYSINRTPSACDNVVNADKVQTFANKAGGILMSVAVEEMLHMSLACNILKALGGKPKIYGKSPEPFPTNLPHHEAGFSFDLSKLTEDQLEKFMEIEQPEAKNAPPQGNNWETIGQFYDFIEGLIKKTTKANYKNPNKQLTDDKNNNYYAANNIDTVYPKNANYIKKPINPKNPSKRGSSVATYPNDDDSGHLIKVVDQASALKAITIIKDQGEGNPNQPNHKYDDPSKQEDSHWFKYYQLHKQIKKFSPDQLNCFVYDFATNPTYANTDAKYQPLVRLTNAIYSYLLWITEVSFNLSGAAQHSMFYIGMHKGMIFILDKIIGNMRGYKLANGQPLSPTFENYEFLSIETAKDELVNLAISLPDDTPITPNIIERIKNLPDVNVPASGVVQFS